MFQKVILVSVLFAGVYGNGGYGGAGLGGLGGGFVGGIGGGLGGGFGGGIGPGPLAVNTRQRVNYIPVASTGFAQPTNVLVESQSGPVNLQYRTISSPVSLNHVHIPSPGSFRETSSVDGAHRRVHTVTKPIIQEVREIITPQRIVRQQVLPVQEDVQTVVARNVGVNGGAAGGLVGGGFIGGGLVRGGGLGGFV